MKCRLILEERIAEAPDPAARRAELVRSYEEQFNNPYFAASLGTIDEIIRPKETRRRIAVLLEALKDKAETRLPKKHNNIPL
jgi:methylmalonyl-CoA decarboxylase subunit alpha